MDHLQNSTRLFASQYLPSTFEERGATAPFTTPILSCARVRSDERHNLVLLTPGFAGTASVYVLPWRAIPELVTMTIHDRALHEAIQETNATSPDTMRREVLTVAATGLAGPEVQAAARKAIRDDENYAEQIQAVLILFLLHGLGIDVTSLVGLDLSRSDVLSRAKAALQSATTPLGVDLETLYDRMGALSLVLRGLGLTSFGDPGRIRIMLEQLVGFERDMINRSNREVGDSQAFFGLAAEVAKHTIAPANTTLNNIDSLLKDLPSVVKNWEKSYPVIFGGITRLSWLLDGWDYVIGFAKGADNWNGADLWENLDTLARMLPIVPRAEKDIDQTTSVRFSEMVQRRRVTAAHDWRTGALDQEFARRLEGAKSAALQ